MVRLSNSCLGVNFNQIPVNAPRCPVHSFHRDGAMRVDGREIYTAKDLRVGLFTSTEGF